MWNKAFRQNYTQFIISLEKLGIGITIFVMYFFSEMFTVHKRKDLTQQINELATQRLQQNEGLLWKEHQAEYSQYFHLWCHEHQGMGMAAAK